MSVQMPLNRRQQGTLNAIYRNRWPNSLSNVNLNVRLRGNIVSQDALRRAIALLMRWHEALRMRAIVSAQELSQYFVDPVDFYCPPCVCIPSIEAAKSRISKRMTDELDPEGTTALCLQNNLIALIYSVIILSVWI